LQFAVLLSRKSDLLAHRNHGQIAAQDSYVTLALETWAKTPVIQMGQVLINLNFNI
jgi:hypothetical protein